jgi:hypothetical protein
MRLYSGKANAVCHCAIFLLSIWNSEGGSSESSETCLNKSSTVGLKQNDDNCVHQYLTNIVRIMPCQRVVA